MRMKKNEQALSLDEHKKIAKVLNDFVLGMKECEESIAKGFSQKSVVSKKLDIMTEIASFLKYSLQQHADLHRKKLGIDGEDFSAKENQDWSRVYLGGV